MPKYSFIGDPADFPAHRIAVENFGTTISLTCTNDNVLMLETDNPIPADLVQFVEIIDAPEVP